MTYLVGQLLTCLSLAGLLGLLVGWLVWGLAVRKERQRAEGLESRLTFLEPFPGKLKDLETAHAVLQTSRAAEAAKFTQRIGELEPQAAKLTQVEKNLATKTAEADALRKQCSDLTNTHAVQLEQREQQLKALQAQIQDSQKKLSDGETQHAAALKAKDAEIAQHVASHADKDARLSSLLGRVAEAKTVADKVPVLEGQIAELTPLAALVPALKSDLADKDTTINGLLSQVGDLQPQAARVAELETAHAAKDAKIAELSSVAELVPVLQSHVAEKDAQIRAHETAHTEKDAKIAELAAAAALVPVLQSKISEHETAHAEKDAKIAELAAAAASVPVLQSKISEHEAAHAEKDAQLYAHEQVQKVKDTKIAELASLSEWVPTLNAQVGEKDAKIAELAPLAALAPELKAQLGDKDTHISGLLGQVDELHGQIAQHEAALDAKDAEIAQHQEAHAAKDAKIAELVPLAALVPELKAQLAQHEAAQGDSVQVAQLRSALDAKDAEIAQHQEAHAAKDAHIASLTSRVEDAEYENNLNTRKMRMQEAGSSVSEQEVARLHEQVTLLTAQLANVNEQHAATVAELTKLQAPPMAMAAAAGFYSASTTVAPQTQEYEKHIDELQSAAQAREAEVAKLRQRVAEIEAAPDPDSKRQILSAAKDAEIKHLKETLNALFAPLNNDDVAARAYNYAKERGFTGGSQTEDWLRAERDTHFARLAAAWEGTRTGTLY